ncbi:MAG: ribulokinase [Chitinivibrionales bacterium]|nr:ribulokinase [Chitinivibrionales bacterium]
MANDNYCIGLDFGTDSVRAVIVDARNGREVASAVDRYRRWAAGSFCNSAKNRFRQHPLDYIESLERACKSALKRAPRGSAQKVRAVGVDATGSTPVAVDKNGTPLALLPRFKNNPNAMFILWKDHCAIAEAAEITALAHSGRQPDYTKYCGGIYSSEWFWSKILHVLRNDRAVEKAAFSWVEQGDWISALLTGNTNPSTFFRSRCAAGHKALWHEEFGGLPSESFLGKLDARLGGLRDRLYEKTFTMDCAAGALSAEWAKRLGLGENVVVNVGAIDAHVGAVGANIRPYMLCKVMGTSTCDMLVAPLREMQGKFIRGICGQVDGSIIPGMLGMEAGQSAFGDLYAWFKDLLLWPEQFRGNKTGKARQMALADDIIPQLSKAASLLAPGESGIAALDWHNGRRTPDANQALKGAMVGLTLGSDAPRIFRALVEATAFGSKKIVERFIAEGVPIRGVIALGGISKKAPFVMQIVADVLGMPIRVLKSEQACALGAAMCAATAAGIYPTLPQAQQAMDNGFEKEYKPIPMHVRRYAEIYKSYCDLGRCAEQNFTL